MVMPKIRQSGWYSDVHVVWAALPTKGALTGCTIGLSSPIPSMTESFSRTVKATCFPAQVPLPDTESVTLVPSLTGLVGALQEAELILQAIGGGVGVGVGDGGIGVGVGVGVGVGRGPPIPPPSYTRLSKLVFAPFELPRVTVVQVLVQLVLMVKT